MARVRNYIVGDFVRYSGNHTVGEGHLVKPGIGRIDGFEDSFGVERIDLFLSDRHANIWCDYENVREIETEEKHLIHCGFSANMVGNAKRFLRGAMVISGGTLPVYKLNSVILTGFCLGDLTAGVRVDKYIVDGEFKLELLFKDFPWVNNINDFIDFLKSHHMQYNWEAIASL